MINYSLLSVTTLYDCNSAILLHFMSMLYISDFHVILRNLYLSVVFLLYFYIIYQYHCNSSSLLAIG